MQTAKTLNDISDICFNCAKELGFKPKDKAVGVWVGECSVCHETKPCTDAHHDWYSPNSIHKI